MNIAGRQSTVFASGLLLGVAAGACLVLALRSPQSPAQQTEVTRAPAPPSKSTPAGTTAVAAPEAPTCPERPAVTAVGDKDGRFEPKADLSGSSSRDVSAYIVIGKEAAAAGRPRDAEVAFLMSCRVAEKLKGVDSVEAADARYQLGRHYANHADGGTAARTDRGVLLARSQQLYADSLRKYRAEFGQDHEKSRFAAQGLAAVRQAASVQPQPARPAPPVAAASPAPPPVRTARAPPEQPRASAARAQPSFDCAKARSVPEKIICTDPELAQMDRELARLHARAKNSASDRAAFKRQNDAEWRRRETTCRDRECLLRWYAQRRDQLMGQLGPRTGAFSALF